MATALASALAKIPVRRDIAMTGEITLRGKVLAIGGLKEKLLAAQRAGVFEVILPRANEKDIADLPEALKNAMKLHFVDQMDEVLRIALESPLKALDESVPEALTVIPPSELSELPSGQTARQ
jgi:ATP-dependent Lon protease